MESSTSLAQRIRSETGQDVHACRQSAMCTASCPLAGYFDWTPTQIMQAVQFGEPDLALASRTLWLCASCQTCATTCPNGLDLASVMTTLADAARERGIRPGGREAGLRRKVFLPFVDLRRRVHELGLEPEAGRFADGRLSPSETLTAAALAALAPFMALGYLLGVFLHHIERRIQHY